MRLSFPWLLTLQFLTKDFKTTYELKWGFGGTKNVKQITPFHISIFLLYKAYLNVLNMFATS